MVHLETAYAVAYKYAHTHQFLHVIICDIQLIKKEKKRMTSSDSFCCVNRYMYYGKCIQDDHNIFQNKLKSAFVTTQCANGNDSWILAGSF